jgi:hypothetical protein
LPAGDTEKEVRESKNPSGPFVAMSRNGELLPGVKEIISIIAKHGLVVASGHIVPEDALMVLREAKRQGVQHMIATHAFDLARSTGNSTPRHIGACSSSSVGLTGAIDTLRLILGSASAARRRNREGAPRHLMSLRSVG